QIFRDHWKTFQQHQPRYQDRHVQAVIDKMLGCGTLEAGYTTYLCPHCLEEKRVAFSCKSSFCLSCCKVYVDEWVSHIGRTLYEGAAYRHTVLTMPDALHIEFYRGRPLLAALMKCAVEVLSDALSWCKQIKLAACYAVVHVGEGELPAGGEGLGYYLAKYVVGPPISLRRILSYDGQRVRYWYNDHKTKQRQEEEVSALTFIGRMVQHILPKGFHRIRYYGLHATCKAKKVKVVLTALMVALGRLIKGTYRIAAQTTYRARVLVSTGRDPLRCTRCGGEMMVGKVWRPRYGVVCT